MTIGATASGVSAGMSVEPSACRTLAEPGDKLPMIQLYCGGPQHQGYHVFSRVLSAAHAKGLALVRDASVTTTANQLSQLGK